MNKTAILAYFAGFLIIAGAAIHWGVGLGLMVWGILILVALIGIEAKKAQLERNDRFMNGVEKTLKDVSSELQRQAEMAEAQK